MPITQTCDVCDTRVEFPDSAAGKREKCPRCDATVKVRGSAPPARGRDVEEYDDPPSGRPRREAAGRDDTGDEPQTDLPRHLLEQVFGELTQGEKLIWACQPSPRVMHLRGVGMLIGGCFFAGIGLLFAGIFARNAGFSFIPILVAVVFGGAGLGIGLLGLTFAKKQAKTTIYALTNRRAIVWRTQYFGSPNVEHYDATAVRNLKRKDNYFIKGAGDVIFRQEKTIVVTTSKHGSSTSERIKNYGFLHVEAAREVEKLVREALHIRFRDDDTVVPNPNPAAVVRAQAATAGQPVGPIATVGLAVAAVLFLVPAGIGASFMMNAPVPKQGAFVVPGGYNADKKANPEKKKVEPGSPEDWENIVADLNGTDGFKRSAAADRLAKMKPDDEHRKDVVPVLASKLTEGHGADECARALAVWAAPEDAKYLVTALKSPSGGVKNAAISGLTRLKVPDTADALASLLITSRGDREKVKAALVAIGPPAEPAVAPLLAEADRNVRIDALQVLAKVGTAASLPAIDKMAVDAKAKERNVSREAEDAAKEIRKRK